MTLIRKSPSGPERAFMTGLSDIKLISAIGSTKTEAGTSFVDMPSGAVGPFPTDMEITHTNVALGASILVSYSANLILTAGVAEEPSGELRIVRSIDGGADVEITETRIRNEVDTTNITSRIFCPGLIITAPLVAAAATVKHTLQWRNITGTNVSIDPDGSPFNPAVLWSAVIPGGIVRP